uniref:Ribosomal_S10 domain-containing protein n=1 Tax=Globodera pallida TaxID=36090 RepID=A0A183CGV0_GLOPA
MVFKNLIKIQIQVFWIWIQSLDPDPDLDPATNPSGRQRVWVVRRYIDFSKNCHHFSKVDEFIHGFGCYLTKTKTMPRVFWRGTYFQPFAVKLFPGIWRKHNRFLVKTVMVQNNDVDTAFHLLNRLMEREGLMKIIRNTVRYQKPYMQRNQLSMEASNAILEEDRDRKFKFLVRKHRADAYPGQLTM